MKKLVAFIVVLCMTAGLCLAGCASPAETTPAETGAVTSPEGSASSGGDLPAMKLGLPMENVTAPAQYSYYANLNYVCTNFPNGGEVVAEIDDLTDPDHLITSVEKLIAAGCNMLTICPPNDTMLIKVSQLCEEAGVYWAVAWREIMDEEVKEIVSQSPYFVGTVVQNDYQAGYAAVEAMGKAGMKKIALISLDKSSSTAVLREQGMADAAEKYDIEVVAEARDLQQATDSAQAVESFLVSYPDLDGVFIAGSMGLNILDGVMSALEQYDPDGNVKISLIDFLPGLDACFEADRVISAQGGIYVPVQLAASALCINAITNGERMGGQAWDVPVTFGSLSTAEEFEQYSKFVEGDLPLYTFDELKDSLYTYYNPDLTGEDIIAWAEAYDLATIYEMHADLEPPVSGPNADYVGYSSVSQ